jgi:hypothetical protein
MDTLSGKQDDSESLSLTEWEAALAAEDPAALVSMLSKQSPPSHLGSTPWAIVLARKVSIVQWWASGNWQSDFYEGWMQAWRKQPQIPAKLWPEILQEALIAMGKSEQRFKPGQMHHSLWVAHVDQMITLGMDLNAPLFFDATSCTALDFLLARATDLPYPELADYWIQKHGATFSKKTAEDAIEILDRMQHPDFNNATIGRVFRHLFLSMCDYEHDTQEKIATWLRDNPLDLKDPELRPYIEHLFLCNQTQHSSAQGTGRRL